MKAMTTFPFWSCPACGRWTTPERLRSRVASPGPQLQAKPGGRGKPWATEPLSPRARSVLANLLVAIAQRLKDVA